MHNFLPFARRERITIPAAVSGKPGRSFARFQKFGTGSALKAHIDDIIVNIVGGYGYGINSIVAPRLKMRIGKDGHQFLTEEYYDYRCYQDGHAPLRSVWNWSGIKRNHPYRLYPGQQMHTMIGLEPEMGSAFQPNQNVGVLYFGRKVSTGEAWNLYDGRVYQTESFGEVPAIQSDPIMLGDCVTECPHDSPVDLYGMSVSLWKRNDSASVYVIDGNERPFWPDKRWYGIIDPQSTPILLGNARGTDEWVLAPNEIITFDFETPEEAFGGGVTELEVDVTIRGTLEVEDGQ